MCEINLSFPNSDGELEVERLSAPSLHRRPNYGECIKLSQINTQAVVSIGWRPQMDIW